MNREKRLLIFDFDGVIADSLVPFRAAVQSAWIDCGMAEAMTDEQFLRVFDTNMYAGMVAIGLAPDRVDTFLHVLKGHLESCADCPFFAGIAEVMGAISRCNHVVVVTSNIGATVRGLLERHGVTGVKDVLGAERGTSKVEKIRQVVHRYPGVPAYYVGDTCGDIVEGRNAGVRTVAAGWGWHGAERLAAVSPDLMLERPADLLARFGSEKDSTVAGSRQGGFRSPGNALFF